MRLRVHIQSPPPDYAVRALKEELGRGVVLSFGPQEASPDTEVLVAGRPTRQTLEACPKLRVLVIPYAGVPAATRELLLSSFPGLTVCNLHHNAAVAAELAIALLLAAAKRIVPADAALRRGDWRIRYEGESTLLLEGKVALVLGLGAIGTRVAAVCGSLGMTVHGLRRRTDRPALENITVHPLSELGSLLPSADALMICLPLTPETEGLIGSKELAAMQPTAVLVNVARGGVVDEKALFEALSKRSIAAAGVDVWYRYPTTPEERKSTLPSRFAFQELDNVVLSPHRGGAFRTEEVERERMRHLAAILNSLACGETVPHVVDIRAGY